MSEDESFVILGSSPSSSSVDIYANVSTLSMKTPQSPSSKTSQKCIDSTSEKSEDEMQASSAENASISKEMGNSTRTENNYSLLQQSVNDMGLRETYFNSGDDESTLHKNMVQQNMSQREMEMPIKSSDKRSSSSNEECKSAENLTQIKHLKNSIVMQSQQEQTNTGCSISKQNVTSGPGNNVSTTMDGCASGQNSLASSFLMGEIEVDVLRANVFSQFPSLCGSQAKPTEILKLQTLMTQYVDLKETLQKNNEDMKQYFTTIQKWQNEIKSYKDDQSKQIGENIEHIARLRNENLRLQQELDTKSEQIQINSSFMKKENDILIKGISEKESIIRNLSEHINKLEQVQHHSFEFLRKPNEAEDENQYITIAKHKQQMWKLENLLSELKAENICLKNMEKTYLNEIDNLKVQEISAEELLKKARADICILQSKDLEKCELFQKCKKENNDLRLEISALREQLNIYAKDFDIERIARQNLAGEKDLLIRDLQMLQKRNQELLETQERLKQNTNRDSRILGSSSSTRSFTKGQDNIASASYQSHKEEVNKFEREEQTYQRSIFICPICNASFNTVGAVERHVNECMEKV